MNQMAYDFLVLAVKYKLDYEDVVPDVGWVSKRDLAISVIKEVSSDPEYLRQEFVEGILFKAQR